VQRLKEAPDDATAAELRSLCAAHGVEAALNALYFGEKSDAASRVRDALGDLLPAQAWILSLFEGAGLLDPRGLEFSRTVAGTTNGEPLYAWGWLVDDGTVLLGDDLYTTRVGPRRAALRRPEAREGSDPFRDYCRKTLSVPLPDPQGTEWPFRSRIDVSDPRRFCVLAYWSFRRGEVGHAKRLLDRARATFVHSDFRGNGGEETFEEFVREDLATTLEQRAVLAAMAGEPWTALRERWRTAVRVRGDRAPVLHDPPMVPPMDLGVPRLFAGFGWHEASEMVRFYDRLIDEDRTWREPTPEELRRWDGARRSRYWTRRLRDSRAGRWATGSHTPSEVFWGGAEDPARHLLALGWTALPDLIEHYEDPTPTRGFRSYYSRATGHTSYTPWRYGNVCTELMHVITGEVFASREEAARWWETARRRDPAGFYLVQLGSDDAETREKAALWLANMDEAAYTDAVVARVMDWDPSRKAMLAFLRGHLRGENADRIALLLRHSDFWTALAATSALQGSGRGRAARRVLLERLPMESDEWARIGFSHLAAMQDGDVRTRFARALASAKGDPLRRMLDSAHLFPGPEVLSALMELLHEDSRAITAVERMLIPRGEESGERVGRTEPELRAWLKRNHPDWATLRELVRVNTVWCGPRSFYPPWFW
jgi:hypothetical protein